MAVTIKSLVTLTTATLALLIGFIWLRKRKKPKPLQGPKSAVDESMVYGTKMDQTSERDSKGLFLQDEKPLFITSNEQSITDPTKTENRAPDDESDVPVIGTYESTTADTNVKTSVTTTDESTVCGSHDSIVVDQDSKMQSNILSEETIVGLCSGLQGSRDENGLNDRGEEAARDATVCSSESIMETEDGSSELLDTCAVEQPVADSECKSCTTEESDDANCLEEKEEECSSDKETRSQLSLEGVVSEEAAIKQTILVPQNDVEGDLETHSMNTVCQAKACPVSMTEKEVFKCNELTVNVTSDVAEEMTIYKNNNDTIEARNDTAQYTTCVADTECVKKTKEMEVSSMANTEQKPRVETQSETLQACMVEEEREGKNVESTDKIEETTLKTASKSSHQPTTVVQKKYIKPSQQSDAMHPKASPRPGQKFNKTKADTDKDSMKKKNSPGNGRGRKDFPKRQRVSKVNNNIDTKPFVSSKAADGVQTTYEFNFPTSVCGMLIGRMGRHVNQIKDLSGVEISVRHKMYTNEHQLVILKGTQAQIEAALVLLRERFPVDRFPDVTFELAEKELPVVNLEQLQLTLPEGPPIEVQVSSVVTPNHVFLQQPNHPSFYMLEKLNQSMNACYAQDGIVPQLPRPIEVGVICAAPVLDTGWYRAQVVESYPETDEVELKFLDYGGYMGIQGCMLRQIRCDFSQLPFQAVECYLANVMEPTDSGVFPTGANEVMQHLVKGRLLQAQVVGHEVDGVPYIQLYDVQVEQTLCINSELVNRGIAQPVEDLQSDKQVADEVDVLDKLQNETNGSVSSLADHDKKDTVLVTPRSLAHSREQPESRIKSANSCATIDKSLLSDNQICAVSGASASQEAAIKFKLDQDTAGQADDEEGAVKESSERDENKECSVIGNSETQLNKGVESAEDITVSENKKVAIENTDQIEENSMSSLPEVKPSGSDVNEDSVIKSNTTQCDILKDNVREQLIDICEGTESCTEMTGKSTGQTLSTNVTNSDHKTQARQGPVERRPVNKPVLRSNGEHGEEMGIICAKDKGSKESDAKQGEDEKAFVSSSSSHISEVITEEQSTFNVERSAGIQGEYTNKTCNTCHVNKPSELSEAEKSKQNSDIKSAISKEQQNSTNSNPDKSQPVELSTTTTTEDEISNTLGNIKKTAAVSSTSSNSPNFMNSAGSSEIGSNDHDLQSEISADSGRGGSVAEMSSPARSPSNTPTVYQFDFPTVNCGMLIGKRGRQINRIKDLSGVEISVRHKKFTDEYNLVVLEGTQAQIDKALELLRERFPLDKFPDITFEPAEQDQPVLRPEHMQLSLPEGVPVDVLVSSVVAPNHVFLQQPTHPTFHMLQLLNDGMNACYSQTDMVPELPRPIEVGVICAAPVVDAGWYRAQVVESYPETDEVELRFLDYGGYMWIQGSLLRQIRYDFSQLPFQAYECYLANVVPPEDAETFSSDATAIMQQLVHNRVLQAQVVGHEVDSVPYVQLYELQGDQAVLINKELVTRGVAQWVEQQS